MDVEGDVAN